MMSSEKLFSYTQSQRDRLAFIDLRVRYLGEIRRNELASRFGIQVVAATRDISVYKELAPHNLVYNSREKIYERGEPFEPVFDFPVERVLAWIYQGFGDVEPCRSKPIIQCEYPDISQNPNLDVLSTLTRAIQHKNVVEISIQGVPRNKSKNEITPFALANGGYGWVVRGYDRQSENFCDVPLVRISEAKLTSSEVLDNELQANDIQWNRIVELELAPHPNNIRKSSSVELDYGMKDGIIKVKVRAALVGYFLRRWGVDCSEKHSLKGAEYQLWLSNRQTLYGVENLSIAPGHDKK